MIRDNSTIRSILAALMLPMLVACGSDDGGSSGVPSAGNASFAISWDVPQIREDGTPLAITDIREYRIYYGMEEGEYNDIQSVTNSTLLDTVISGLAPGTYYVVVTAIDNEGRESSFSEPVEITTI